MADKPIIFISYSHRDEGWKDQLLPHIRMLEELGTLTMWDDRQIGVGDAWFEEITERLDRCKVAVLLVSADFLASQFCMRDEVPPLLERWEPRIGLRAVNVFSDAAYDGAWFVQVEYEIKATHDERSIVYPFFLAGEEEW